MSHICGVWPSRGLIIITISYDFSQDYLKFEHKSITSSWLTGMIQYDLSYYYHKLESVAVFVHVIRSRATEMAIIYALQAQVHGNGLYHCLSCYQQNYCTNFVTRFLIRNILLYQYVFIIMLGYFVTCKPPHCKPNASGFSFNLVLLDQSAGTLYRTIWSHLTFILF